MGRPPRLSSITYKGPGAYFVTVCTHQRGNHFNCTAAVDLTLSHFLRSAERAGVEVSAYCFMPDHVHLLMTALGATSDLARFMHLGKQTSGYAFEKSEGRRLWQTGYHERVLRADEDALTVIAYMVANPIRGGLVERAEDWPHWGSARYSREDVIEAIMMRPDRRGTWRP